MKKDYIPDTDGNLDTWEDNFYTNIDAIAGQLQVPGSDVADTKQKVTDHRTSYTDQEAKKAAAKAAVSTNKLNKKTAVKASRKMANQLKSATGYTEAMGNLLRIIGEDSTWDSDTAKPIISLKHFGNEVEVSFTHPVQVKVVKIMCKRGDQTTFTFVGNDTNTPYDDHRTNVNPTKPEVRTYIVIYLDDDGEEMGLPSDPKSIIVPPQVI